MTKMRLTWVTFAAAGMSLTVNAAQPAAAAFVTVDITNVVREVKPMHAVNNGPTVKKPDGDQKCGNFEDYKAVRIPFARMHDSINCVAGGANFVGRISDFYKSTVGAEHRAARNCGAHTC